MASSPTQQASDSARRRAYEMVRLGARQARDGQVLEDPQDAVGWPLTADTRDYLDRLLRDQGVVTDSGQGRAGGSVARVAMTDLVPAEPAPGLGQVTIRELLHRVVPATPIVQYRLASEDDQVLLVEQVVSLGDEPLFHAVGYSPVDTADHVSAAIRAIDRHPRSLDMAGLFLDFFGVPLGRVTVGIGAVRADLRTARLLKTEPDTATLVREFWQYDTVGRPRSYNFTQFRPDRVRLVVRQRMRHRASGASGAINTLLVLPGKETCPEQHGSCRATDVAIAIDRPVGRRCPPCPGPPRVMAAGPVASPTDRCLYKARHESG